MGDRLATRVFEVTPRLFRRTVQRLWYLPLDLLDLVMGRRHPLLPPRGYRFDGAEAFERVGVEMLGLFRSQAKLRPDAQVLDVGSGIGRIAIPLTSFLGSDGGYVGLDINRSDISWCKKITQSFPDFRFVHADVHSVEYNPTGSVSASDFRMPFPSESFDFVCAISLFTHLMEGAAVNYVREIARVLKPGGTCFLTFFLMNGASHQAVAEGKTLLRFTHQDGLSYSHDPENPEAAIAFDEEVVLSTLVHLGLEVARPVYGYWASGSGLPTYQDIVVATKPVTSVD